MIIPVLLLLLFADDPPPEQHATAELAKVRRIYVDLLSGGHSAMTIRDMLMSSIQASKLFIVTEDQEKADAVLKGSGQDEIFTDSHSSSDSINAHSQISLPGVHDNSTVNQRYSDRSNVALSVGENENHKSEERKHEAVAAVRLVNKNGDVIWSATEESMGAKFMGASADVVDKITKKLAADYRRAKAPPEAKPKPE
ncbi:MAG TPA: hypothetical protein VKU01_10510 [Bryobacteraceae bacterium]|nr:hypothetical protein [Bryobacteraceae bacterium]